jgi:hypothetical protein
MQRATSHILSFATLASMAVGLACGTSPGSSSGSSSGSGTSGTTSGAGSGSATGSTSGTTSAGASSGGAGGSPCGAGASTTTVSYANDLMPIIQANCSLGGTMIATATCHAAPGVENPGESGGSRQYFGPPSPPTTATTTPSLTTIYQQFVTGPTGPVASLEDPSMNIVDPGNPATSFLWLKLTMSTTVLLSSPLCSRGDYGSCGSQMPLNESFDGGAVPPFMPLPQADLDLFCNWIVQGAMNN